MPIAVRDFARPLAVVVEENPALRQAPRDAAVWAAELGFGPTLAKWRAGVAAHCDSELPRFAAAPALQQFLRQMCRSHRSVVSPALRGELHPSMGAQFVLRKPVDAGTLLLSVPTATVLQVPPPKPSDDAPDTLPLLRMVEALLTALADAESPHHAYATYLRSVPVPANLPFLEYGSIPSAEPLQEALGRASDHPDVPGLRGVPAQHVQWAASVILSRWMGGCLMVPVYDVLNHAPSPTMYYTMATPDDMSVLDVVDNLMAGVPDDAILEPYVHSFAIAKLRAGDVLTQSYSDCDPKDAEGADVWRASWGFLPDRVAEVDETSLLEAASVLCRRRVLGRAVIFP